MNPAMCKKEFLYSWFLNIIQTLLDKVGFSQECKVGIIFENQLVLFIIITKLRNHGITLQSWVKAFYKVQKALSKWIEGNFFNIIKGFIKYLVVTSYLRIYCWTLPPLARSAPRWGCMYALTTIQTCIWGTSRSSRLERVKYNCLFTNDMSTYKKNPKD